MAVKILVHAPCYDGFASAYVAKKYFDSKGIPVEFFEGNYSKNGVPDINPQPDDEVYIIDFSFDSNRMMELSSKVKSIQVLDHHATAEKELAGLDFAKFDMNQSGAGMAWSHFFPDQPKPDFIKYIEDRDLWKLELPSSQEFSAGLRSYPYSFEAWDQIFNKVPELIEEGRVILKHQNTMVENCCKKPIIFTHMQNGEILKGAIVEATTYFSDVANYLWNTFKTDFGAYYMYNAADGSVKVGLASNNKGNIDVSAICVGLGGGGHKHAAGAVISLEQFNQFIGNRI